MTDVLTDQEQTLIDWLDRYLGWLVGADMGWAVGMGVIAEGTLRYSRALDTDVTYPYRITVRVGRTTFGIPNDVAEVELNAEEPSVVTIHERFAASLELVALKPPNAPTLTTAAEEVPAA